MYASIKDLPANFPNGFHHVKVGDMVIMFADPNRTLADDHVHIYEVVEKGVRYADLTLMLRKCMFNDKEYATCQKSMYKDWEWFVNYSSQCKWLRSKAEKALFGVSGT